MSVHLGCGYEGEADIYGAHLYVRIGDPDVAAYFSSNDPAFRKQLHDAIQMGANFWGISPYSVKGWRIILQDFGAYCAGYTKAGCIDFWNENITIDVTIAGDIFHSSLMHELGHLEKWNPPFEWSDPGHHDSDWWTCEWVNLWFAANAKSVEVYNEKCDAGVSNPPLIHRADEPWCGFWRGAGNNQGNCPSTPQGLSSGTMDAL